MSKSTTTAAKHGPETVLTRSGGVVSLTFSRAHVHNALTTGMYQALARACVQVSHDPTARCLVLRGISGGAFAAGTDIAHFRSVRSGDNGVAYEQSVQDVLEGLLDLPVPTLAVIEGYALGGGLLIAAACDLRISTPQAQFGVPIARTLGNCLSQFGHNLLARRLGATRVLQLLLTAELMDAPTALHAGFVAELVEGTKLEARVDRMTSALCRNAPLTMQAAKLADRALRTGDPGPDFVRTCYGSRDFAEGVSAFLDGRRPAWEGS